MILVLGAHLLLGFLQAATSSQTPASTAAATQSAPSATLAHSSTPTDPKELLDLGRKVNGLTGPDVQPWHLKASFEVFDDDGKSKDKGTFEEWWISDKQYKRSYQSAGFTQTQYGTDHGVLLSGNPDWPRGWISSVRLKLVNPLPNDTWVNSSAPKLSDRDFAGIKLHCVYMDSKLPPKDITQTPVYPSFALVRKNLCCDMTPA